MNTIELAWYCFVALAAIFCLSNWRKGVYIAIVVDVLRDPVRKLTPGQPILMTLSGVVVWLGVLLAVLIATGPHRQLLYQRYSQLRTAMMCLLMAIIPAAGVTIISYERGWLVAIIGAMSYLLPTLGVLAGFAFLRAEADAARMMAWYVLINLFALVSVPMEYFDLAVPALGGIDHDWIRYRSGYTVDLMCGWYRSPDIMGLHAAHVIIFSAILGVRPQSKAKSAWLLPILFAGFCVLVSGRRKMLGMPLVFLAVYLLLGSLFRVTKIGRLTAFALISLLCGAFATVWLWSPEESAEYTDFATTLFTEGITRSRELVVGSTLGTLQQVGVIGGGLGMATQGKYYAGVSSARHLRGWQEDGISRLFFEFGIPGVVLLALSFLLLLSALLRSLRGLSVRSNEILMQFAIVAVVASDAASFIISHQQFSGDPVNALMVTFLFGMILKFPLILRPK